MNIALVIISLTALCILTIYLLCKRSVNKYTDEIGLTKDGYEVKPPLDVFTADAIHEKLLER